MTNPQVFEKVQYGVWIKLSDIKVHPLIQRRFDLAWAKYILSHFDPDALGSLQVVKDGKGGYFVFDGQHRTWAAREYLGNDQRIACDVHENLSTERLAQLFREVNKAKALKAVDDFLMAVKANEEIETRITEILKRHHLKVDYCAKQGTVRAVVALRAVFIRFEEKVLDRTLWTLRAAWGDDPDAYASQFIGGLGFLLHQFSSKIDDKEMSRKISKTSGPSKLIGQTRDLSKTKHTSVLRAMAEILANIYDKGRRDKSLILN